MPENLKPRQKVTITTGGGTSFQVLLRSEMVETCSLPNEWVWILIPIMGQASWIRIQETLTKLLKKRQNLILNYEKRKVGI